MDLVNELLNRMNVFKKEGVIRASVVYSWIGRRIKPLQKRCQFGFEYIGTSDPSRFTAEGIFKSEAVKRVSRVLLDAETVPYIP